MEHAKNKSIYIELFHLSSVFPFPLRGFAFLYGVNKHAAWPSET